ncbi:hypothetical protein PR048_010709 [Dryococelus australis]|uniref:DDE-1 domain-containing protein n=1 Tax=Dryococelus australis TaxID=614101 RepID=A0ABQ9I3F5_9NEOP|nr:hypothetical protein PR048_010709 [Dryococelus australis]
MAFPAMIGLRQSLEALDASGRRATNDPFVIFNSYDLLEDTENSLSLCEEPENMWNLDEIFFCSDPSRVKEHQFWRVVLLLAGSCHLILFMNQSIYGALGKVKMTYLPQTFYGNTAKDYMTSTVFSSYIKEFAGVVKERPIPIIFNGQMFHLEHSTLQQWNYYFKLPPHTTDLLQALNKCCFSPLKAKWNTELLKWQNKNQQHLQKKKNEFVDLFCSIWHEGLSPENVISGFKFTGISLPFISIEVSTQQIN